MASLMDLKSLCIACSNIRLRDIAVSKRLDGSIELSNILEPYNPGAIAKVGCNHLENARDLIESSKTCELCALLKEVARELYLLKVPEGQRCHQQRCSTEIPAIITEDWFLSLPIKFQPAMSYYVPSEGGLGLESFQVAFPFDYSTELPSCIPYLNSQLSVIADMDSPAALSGDVIGRPNFTSASSPEAHAQLRNRIRDCVDNHSGHCDVSLAGETIDELSGVPLPTRVIDVGSKESQDSWLLITQGAHGSYASLSHCWGTDNKSALITTKSNISQHRERIPWSSLPKTFRDAIIITRKIGLQYIWIDSLCIIQDDNNDWLRESSRMGGVFQNSFLTIVAAHAKDGTGGCFYNRNSLKNPLTVEVPYTTKDGEVLGSVKIKSRTAREVIDEIPNLSPIRSRAWVTQEEFLSRRLAYYTKRNILWKCRKLEVSETNEAPPRIQPLRMDWQSIVEEYSQRSLTFEKDKLVALQGLANEIGKRRPGDQYLSGLWLLDLPKGLLWFGQTSDAFQEVGELDIPSWSWASRNGEATFLQLDFSGGSHKMAYLSLENSGHLSLTAPCLPVLNVEFPQNLRPIPNEEPNNAHIAGSIAHWPRAWPDIEAQCKQEFNITFPEEFDLISNLLCTCGPSLFGFHRTRMYLIIDSHNKAIGFCTLDHDVTTLGEMYYCARVVKGYNARGDWHVHYALMLQTTEDRGTVACRPEDYFFQRVGVAVIITDSWINDDENSTMRLR